MTISIEERKVFVCQCVRCGHKWEALKKPWRCASCKRRSWNGEDYRLPDPFHHVPRGSKIETGTEVPQTPGAIKRLRKLARSGLQKEN
jgi:hypothetical protein